MTIALKHGVGDLGFHCYGFVSILHIIDSDISHMKGLHTQLIFRLFLFVYRKKEHNSSKVQNVYINFFPPPQIYLILCHKDKTRGSCHQ